MFVHVCAVDSDEAQPWEWSQRQRHGQRAADLPDRSHRCADCAEEEVPVSALLPGPLSPDIHRRKASLGDRTGHSLRLRDQLATGLRTEAARAAQQSRHSSQRQCRGCCQCGSVQQCGQGEGRQVHEHDCLRGSRHYPRDRH